MFNTLFCSECDDVRPPRPPRPLVPDLLSHRMVRKNPERHISTAAKPPLADHGWWQHIVNAAKYSKSHHNLLCPTETYLARFTVFLSYTDRGYCLVVHKCSSSSSSSVTDFIYVYTRCPLGGSSVWGKLQRVLSSVEDSISCRRTWAFPISATDQDKHKEHLIAAQESWVKAAQVSKSCSSGI